MTRWLLFLLPSTTVAVPAARETTRDLAAALALLVAEMTPSVAMVRAERSLSTTVRTRLVLGRPQAMCPLVRRAGGLACKRGKYLERPATRVPVMLDVSGAALRMEWRRVG